MAVTLDDIRAAARLLDGQIVRTPSVPARRLAEASGAAAVSLKLENLQYTGSFKDRGALNKLLGLAKAEAASGVIAISPFNMSCGAVKTFPISWKMAKPNPPPR